MLDTSLLARALRAGIRLRDKVVVLEVGQAAASDPDKRELLAEDLALARALGIRLVTVCALGAGPGLLDVQGPALRLVAALQRRGERGVVVAAASVVTVHRVPAAIIPVVNPAVLLHLSALGYLPLLVPPAADAEGQPVDLGAGDIGMFVARYTSAAMLLRAHAGAPAALGEAGPGPPVPPVLVTSLGGPGSMIADLLLNAPEVS